MPHDNNYSPQSALEVKAFPDYVPSDSVARWTPLIWAAFNGDTSNLRLLLDAKGDPRKRDVCGEDAKFACVRGSASVEVMEALMKQQKAQYLEELKKVQEGEDEEDRRRSSSKGRKMYSSGRGFTQVLGAVEEDLDEEGGKTNLTPAEQLSRTMSSIDRAAGEQSLEEFLRARSFNNNETLLQVAVDML